MAESVTPQPESNPADPPPVWDAHKAALQEIDRIVGNEKTLGEPETTRLRGILFAALSERTSTAHVSPEPLTAKGVICALALAGWPRAGGRAGVYMRFLWPQTVDGRPRSVLVPLDRRNVDYDDMMAGLLGELRLAVEIGQQARRVLDALAEDGCAAAKCTGVSATWCPVHGDCRCPERDDGMGRTLTDPRCALHAPTSDHAEAASHG